jgi:hypothetical protein
MTTYNITNIAPNLQEMTMVVFYEFSNGNIFTNKVPADTPVTEILKWGQDKCVWFSERDIELEAMKQELIENPVDINPIEI